MEYPKFKVCVRCCTYNHANYIKDAMNGFCIQQTNFPFVCCIIDDASTDGEQNVINDYVATHFDLANANIAKQYETEYAYIIYAQHNTNKNCYFAVVLLKENLFSKKESIKKMQYVSEWRDNTEYEALCEGDDYWIDENKLMKQVCFLDENKEYGMCYSNFNILYENTKTIKEALFTTDPQKFKTDYNLEDWIYTAGYIAPMTWLIKRNILSAIPSIKTCDGTFVYVASFLHQTKIKCLIDSVTAVYRVLDESAAHSKDIKKVYCRNENLLKTQLNLIDYYSLSKKLKDKCLEKYYHNNLKLMICFASNKDLESGYSFIGNNKSKLEIIEYYFGKTQVGKMMFRFLYSIYWKNWGYKKNT